ncbi:MAG: hypothetical protein JO071_12670 [Deltaproteobacteria bacterium]|nr:hypothetical protein [Deltaproteobacteria bacterium]
MDEEFESIDEPQGTRLMSVLYSARGDVYRIPSTGAEFWLSVEAKPAGAEHIVASGRRYYKGYLIVPGHVAALPADDPLVVDYLWQVKAEEL